MILRSCYFMAISNELNSFTWMVQRKLQTKKLVFKQLN